MYHINYIITICRVSQRCLFNYTYMQHATNCMAKFVWMTYSLLIKN